MEASPLAAVATPTTLYLVTVPADATPTLTPFQPYVGPEALLNTPASTETSGPPTATFDPNAIIPPTPTPEVVLRSALCPGPIHGSDQRGHGYVPPAGFRQAPRSDLLPHGYHYHCRDPACHRAGGADLGPP